MPDCSGVHKNRLFIGEANFKGIEALLNKHNETHPNLGKSITATELDTFQNDPCKSCEGLNTDQDEVSKLNLAFANLFTEKGDNKLPCSDLCKRIQSLKNRGVTVILGYDGTKMHKHPLTKNKIFQRIHWNCPHDKSNYSDQTLPPIIKKFFQSAAKMQNDGDRIHITLAQPKNKESFYQGVIYNIRDAATSTGYKLYSKRIFGTKRYPGYQHEQTGSSLSAPGAEIQREFIFIKGKLPEGCSPSKIGKKEFPLQGNIYNPKQNLSREWYVRESDDDSSSYSDSSSDSEEANNL